MKKVQMCEGPIFLNVIRYAFPVILTNILQLLYNAADLIVVGRFCGSNSIAAVGATGSLTNLLVNLFVGLSMGSGVIIAHSLGARDAESTKKAVHTSVALSFVGGILLTVVGVCFSKALLILMGTPADILPLATLYMQIYFGGMIFNIFCFFAGAVINAVGETQKPLIYLSISGITNVILNIFFVTVLNMDVAGVALATVISQILSSALFMRDLLTRTDNCRLTLKKIKFHKVQLLKILGVGLPSGLQSSLFALSNTTIQSAVNSFGSIAISGNSAANNIEGFIYTAMNSFAQTTLNFTGQNLGAKKFDRIKKVLLVCCLCVLVVALILGACLNLFGSQLLSIYITDSAEAIDFGLQRFAMVGSVYFLCGIMDCITCANRGLHHATSSMIISVFFACIFRIIWVNTIFLLPEFHSFSGLFVSYPISWALCIVFQLALFIFSVKNFNRTEKKKI